MSLQHFALGIHPCEFVISFSLKVWRLWEFTEISPQSGWTDAAHRITPCNLFFPCRCRVRKTNSPRIFHWRLRTWCHDSRTATWPMKARGGISHDFFGVSTSLRSRGEWRMIFLSHILVCPAAHYCHRLRCLTLVCFHIWLLAQHQHSGVRQESIITNYWRHNVGNLRSESDYLLLYFFFFLLTNPRQLLSGAGAGGDHHATTQKASPRVGRRSPRITRSTTPVDVLLLQKDDLVYVVLIVIYCWFSRK